MHQPVDVVHPYGPEGGELCVSQSRFSLKAAVAFAVSISVQLQAELGVRIYAG